MKPEVVLYATMGLAVPVLAVWTIFRFATRKSTSATEALYRKIIPIRIKQHPLKIAFFIVWIGLGCELMLHVLPQTMWPRVVSTEPTPIRYVFASLIILSGISMLIGFLLGIVARGAALLQWFGSLTALGLSIAFILGLIRALLSGDYLWPEMVFACGFWGLMTFLLTVSVIETRRALWMLRT